MTFTKKRFPIRARNDVVIMVDGYTFEAVFSTGQVHEMGVHRNGKECWHVTDLNTGYYVNVGATRKKAVEMFQKHHCSRLERMVYSNEHYSSSPACHENTYEHMANEFAELVDEYERGAK